MNFLFTALFGLAAWGASNVVEIVGEETFINSVLGLQEKDEAMFVKFFAPWCGHCKKMAPDWEKLSDELATGDYPKKITVANVDMTKTENAGIKEYFGIRGFPTLIYFANGRWTTYIQPSREYESLHKYAKAFANIADTGSVLDKTTFIKTTTTTTTVSVVNEIVTLTDDNFEPLTQAGTGATTGAWLVKFYAPWCGHCKKLAPEWQKLANSIDRSMGSDLMIAKMDSDAHGDTRTRFGIKSYPTIMLFKGGKMYEYKNARTTEEIIKWYDTGKYTESSNVNEVRPVPTFIEKTVLQTQEIATEMVKIYSTLLSKESVMVMYERQPVLVIAAGSLAGICGILLSYQFISIFFGLIFGTSSTEPTTAQAAKTKKDK